jgi:hypothetical protein
MGAEPEELEDALQLLNENWKEAHRSQGGLEGVVHDVLSAWRQLPSVASSALSVRIATVAIRGSLNCGARFAHLEPKSATAPPPRGPPQPRRLTAKMKQLPRARSPMARPEGRTSGGRRAGARVYSRGLLATAGSGPGPKKQRLRPFLV